MYEGQILKAVQFISQKHKDQKRKVFDYPYISHPLMVYHMVTQYSDDIQVHLAALLHDTVEDTDTNIEEIESFFGSKVAEYVTQLSEDKKLPWKERKEQYIQNFIGAPREVLLIKGADIYYNLQDTVFTCINYPEECANWTRPEWFSFKQREINTIEQEWQENPFINRVKEVFDTLETQYSQVKV